MESGAQCVMMIGMTLMPEWSVGNLASLVLVSALQSYYVNWNMQIFTGHFELGCNIVGKLLVHDSSLVFQFLLVLLCRNGW